MDSQMKKLKVFTNEFILNVVTVSNATDLAIYHNFKFVLNENQSEEKKQFKSVSS
jgi:hypothetical protein